MRHAGKERDVLGIPNGPQYPEVVIVQARKKLPMRN
jgi:hypothetical protein